MSVYPRALATLGVFLCCASNVDAAQVIQARGIDVLPSQIDSILSAYGEQGRFQGAALVAIDGEVIYRRAFGLANVEWQIPNTPETRFTIASLGKAFTAVIVLQLAEEQLLDLSDPISKHLSSYRTDIGDQVTIHHLLSHTAGIPGTPQDWIDNRHRAQYSLVDLVSLANAGELQFEPGTEMSYCNSCYNLLGAMIEQVTGKTFERELHDRILEPLGMVNTGLVHETPILAQRASGYDRLPNGTLTNAPVQNQSYAVGAGGMYSTLDDLLRWDQALYDDRLLSAQSRELMFTAGLNSAGYGWNVGRYVKNGVETHGKIVSGFGGTFGFASVLGRLLDDRYLIVLLSNIRQTPQGAIANDVWNLMLGWDVTLPEPAEVAEAFYDQLLAGNADGARQEYFRLREEESPALPSERDVQSTGSILLDSDNISAAVVAFELNVAVHPASAVAHSRLGNAYLVQGDRERAIECFEKALDLDPESQAAAEALEKLTITVP